MNINKFPILSDITVQGRKQDPVLVLDVIQYFKKYLSQTDKVSESTIVKDDEKEVIFSIWLQGEECAPAVVRACFHSIRKHCKQDLIVLNEKNLFNYIKLPKEIVKKYEQGFIKPAQFSDICRVELLYEHGGYWLDATAFVTEPIPQYIVDSDFFMFLVNPEWDVGYSFIQNCFIHARKGTYLLNAWHDIILNYWMHENHEFSYWMHSLLFKILVTYDDKAKEYFAKMPRKFQDGIYALWDKYKDKKFDEMLFKKITKDAFFQKTTYKGLDNVIPGSFADVMINKR